MGCFLKNPKKRDYAALFRKKYYLCSHVSSIEKILPKFTPQSWGKGSVICVSAILQRIGSTFLGTLKGTPQEEAMIQIIIGGASLGRY